MVGDPLLPVRRRVPETKALLRATIEAWARGPTAEERASGFISGVPSEARNAPILTSITNGVARVEIDHPLATINNFTTTNVTGYFLSGLVENVFQFKSIKVLDLGPLCPELTELVCEPITRGEWESAN